LTKRCSLIFMKFQHCCRYGRLCCPNVERPFNFVASVWPTGPKHHGRLCRRSTKSTDSVEFNFVASVYRA